MSTTETPDSDEDRRGRFAQFFKTEYADEAEDIIDRNRGRKPDHISLPIEWSDLEAADPGLADAILEDPDPLVVKTGKLASIAVRGLEDAYEDQWFKNVEVRINGLPEQYTHRVGDLRTKHLGRLIAVQGEVVKVHGVEPLITRAFFECLRCGTGHEIPQDYGDILEPAQCEACESKNDWRLVQSKSDLIDFQAITLIPSDTNLDDPPVAPVYLTKDLCDRVGEGDEVTVVGVYKTMPFDRQDETQLNTFIEACQIDQEKTTEADKVTSEELADRLLSMVKDRQEQGNDYSANEAEIVDELTDEGIREEEIKARRDELIEQNDLARVGPDSLMAP